MRKIKQFLLTTAVLICSTLNSWAGTTFTDLDITYEITSLTTAKVISCSSDAADIRIGNTVEYGGKSYTVNVIGENAFKNKTNLEYIQFGSGVQSIQAHAFEGCSKLTSIIYLSYVNYIGDYAFAGCTSLTLALFGNLTTIGNYAFSGCTKLTDANYNGDPCKLQSIGNYAFNNCTSLTYVETGASLKSIGNHAFNGCTKFGGMQTGNALQSIGDYAFNGCTKMGTFTMANSETTLGKGVFYGCSKLTNVTLSYKITTIPEETFGYCTSLESIKIPSNATTIGVCAFEGCSKLSSVSGCSSITTIENGAFYLCTGLTQFTIPEKASNVNPFAFNGCTNLAKFYASSSSNYYYASSDGILYSKDKTKIIKYPAAKTGSYTFLNTVTTIGAGAFYECSNLTSLTIPSKITTIEEDAFYQCGFSSITIPKTVTTIAYNGVRVTNIYCEATSKPSGWNNGWCIGNVYWAKVITVEPNNTNYGTVTGGGTYMHGTTVTLKATPKTGCMFVSWSDGGAQTHTISATETKTYTATFLPEITVVSQSNYQSLGLTSDYIGYYAISNASQLYGFAEIVNSGTTNANAVLMSDITVNSNVLKTDGSGALNGNGINFTIWTPIGTNTNKYAGKFDGNGHTISGLYLNDDNVSYVGLFGYSTNNATIKNTSIIDSYFRGYQFVAGFCGYVDGNTKISNCYNASTVFASNPTDAVNGTGDSDAGGICGYMTGSSVIENCHNSGYISAYIRCVGGICGIQFNGTITNCYNTGKVYSYSANDASKNGFIGGITGWMAGTASIENSYNTGNVEAIGKYVGGIIGKTNTADNKATNCHNTGMVSGSGSDRSFVGGISGYSEKSTLEYCYNTGAISGSSSDVGGICGCANYVVENNCYNTGTVSGSSSVGGINGSWGGLTNCFNTGIVLGSGNYVGGLCGKSGTKTNCYYLAGCATDGNGTVQNSTGTETFTPGSTLADGQNTTPVTADQLACGAVALLLNGGTNEGPWFQTVGEDAGPVLDNSHDRVGMLVSEGNTITVSGNVVLLEDYTVEAGQTLVIPADASVRTVGSAVVTNSGTIKCNGTITGNNLAGSGSFVYENLTESDITLNTTSYTYKGSAYTIGNGLDVTVGRQMCGKTFTYDGSAIVTYSNNTNAGEANAATATWNGTISKHFTITPKEVTLEWSNTSLTYNGSAQAPSATATGLIEGDECSVTVSGAQTNAGSNYTATASALSNANYKLPAAATSTFSIAAKEVGLEWSNTAFTYNGSAQAPTATATSLVEGDECLVTVGGAQTNAGSNYTATASALSNANYTLPATATTAFSIAAKEVGLEWSNTPLTYNGSAQAPTATATGLVGNDECNVIVSGAQTNFGSYTATAERLSNGNYKLPNNKTKAFTIDQKVVTLEWGTASFTYNGSEQAPTATATGLVDGDVCNVTVSGAQIDADTYTATASTLSNNNYKLPENKTKAFTINPKKVSLVWSNTTFTYNGLAQVPTATAAGLEESDVCNVTVSGAKINADTYTATASALSNGNYKLPEAKTTAFTINPKEVSLVWSETSFTYNGSAQAPTATATGLEEGDECNVTVEGAQINHGNNHTATATGLSNANYKLPTAVTTTFSIAQATPGYTMPDNQTIACNQTLADITLPAGFAFADVNTILAIGENTVGIIFTPEDAENYKVVDDIEITVTVNHSEVIDPAVPATCTATGLTEGSHCSVCEQELVAQEVVPMIKHTAVTDAAVPATCTATGLTEGSHCSVCDHIIVAQEVVPMAEHTESEAVKENEVAATCTENGSYNSVVYCSVCHAELSRETVTVTAPGHTAGAAVAENPKAATCTAAGSVDSVVYCTVCNAEISRKTVEIPVIAHTVVVDEAVAATTTETGLTEGSHCSVCHQVLVAQQVIPIIEGQGGNVNQGEENQSEENQGNENQGEENLNGNENQGNENNQGQGGEENNQGEENQGNEGQGNENQGGNEGQGEENQGNENQGGNEGQGEENQGEENQGGNEEGNENQGNENQGGNEGQGEENQGEENQGGNEEGNENQ
ncbi:MAG: leucine-rich repeat protein, partial [Salinivirgaceae bacterium]|nr:leucine-rich repeat protein [Salinivirgaceae bacterium]